MPGGENYNYLQITNVKMTAQGGYRAAQHHREMEAVGMSNRHRY